MSMSMIEARQADAHHRRPLATRSAGRRSSAATRPSTGNSSSPSARPASIAGRAAPPGPPNARTCRSTPRREAAARAGYRACKRCRPDKLGASDPKVEAVRRACEMIAAAEEAPKLADLAAGAGMSPFHFHRLFKKVAGVTPKAYAAQMQARRARRRLRTARDGHRGDLRRGVQLLEPLLRESCGSARHDAERGPARGKGRGDPLRDRPGVAWRGAGGRDRQGRVRDHARRRSRRRWRASFRTVFRAQSSSAATRSSSAWSRGRRPRRGAGERLDLPLDIRGTAFQERVWQALRAIPAGKTATYAEIAERSAGRRPCALSPRPAPPIRWRSRSPAIGWCGRTATFPATAGASSASASCSRARRRDEGRSTPTPLPEGEAGAILLPWGEGGPRADERRPDEGAATSTPSTGRRSSASSTLTAAQSRRS